MATSKGFSLAAFANYSNSTAAPATNFQHAFVQDAKKFYAKAGYPSKDEIGILDEVLKDVADEVGELKEKTIEPLDGSIVIPPVTGNTTYIGVNIDSEDKHIVLGDNGLYFDGDFGTGEEDED
jgi:hypothetical protein